jgi:GH25 family lysozyme M1 (1,4-beta-N-acetylmuramidase)
MGGKLPCPVTRSLVAGIEGAAMWALRGRGLPKIVLGIGLGVAVVTAISVTAVAETAAVSHPRHARAAPRAPEKHRQPVNHFNVGATHSPTVLRQLAGWTGGPENAAKGAALPAALQGVDVASYQHPGGEGINWPKVARSGIQFAAVKATEGTYYRNPFALSDLAQAKAAGLSVIAYTFAIPNGNGGSAGAAAQADYLVNYLASVGGPLPPIMLDIEYNPYGAECYGLSQPAMVSWIAQFSREVQARTGEDPIIYGPVPWWLDCTGGTAHFGQFPLWVPDYTSAPTPEITSGWSTYGFWQYSSAGTVGGIDAPGGTDLDQLNPAGIPLLDPGPQAGAAGGTVNLRIEPADPVAGQALSFTAAGLPAGVTISPAGQITGWPVTVGTYQAMVSASDSQGRAGSVSFGWTVSPGTSAGAAGPVELQLGGQCLAVAGGAPAEGTPAVLGACTPESAQGWTYAPDGSLRIDGECLTIPAAAQGAAVELEPCASSAAQQWHLVYPRGINPALGSRHTALVSPWSGMCLADPGFSETAGTKAALWPCDGYANQAWTLPPGPLASQIPGMCLDDSGGQAADGTKVDMWACNGTAGQAWQPGADGTVRINGKCLDVEHGANATGSPVDLYTCNGTAAQQWNLMPAGAGVALLNPGSGLCLADPGDATAAGTQLVIAACTAGDPGMAWRQL